MKKQDERAYYFPHDVRARADLKIRALVSKYGIAGYGAWWVVVEVLRESEGYCIDRGGWVVDALDNELPGLEGGASAFLDYLLCLGLLIEDESGKLFSASLARRMERLDGVREKRSAAGKKSAEKRATGKPAEEEQTPQQKTPQAATADRREQEARAVAQLIGERYPVDMGNNAALLEAARFALRDSGSTLDIVRAGLEEFLTHYAPFCSPGFMKRPDNWLKEKGYLNNWRDMGTQLRTRGSYGKTGKGFGCGGISETAAGLASQFEE